MKYDDLKIFTKIPTIKTERLILRKIELSDLPDVYEYAKDPEVSKYLLWKPHENIGFTKRYLKYLQKLYKTHSFYDWGITYNGKLVGTVGFTHFNLPNNSAEIGYVLNRKFWKKGIASEAVTEIIKFGFERLNLNRIEAIYLPENEMSKRLLQRCKMTCEGLSRKALIVKGEYRDIEKCAILKDDYVIKDN